MKAISYNGSNIELTAVRFTFRDETTIQDGVLLHDTNDINHDGDAIYGNGWTLDQIEDASDVESLITSGDGTTYWRRNDDGTYTMEA